MEQKIAEIAKSKLTQPELGILYVETQAALGLQQCLSDGQLQERDKIALHQIISGQKPDVALICLGLCGVVLANYVLANEKSQDIVVLATEMKHVAIGVVEQYGRAWIDQNEHEKIDTAEQDLALLEQAPEMLNAMGSVLEEIEPLLTPDHFVAKITQLLGYQSYAQADLAEQYLNLIKVNRAPYGDPIPLPVELQD